MGSVGVLFGLFVVGGSFLMGDEKPPPGQKQDGAFKVGQMVGTVFGFLLLGVGAYYVYRLVVRSATEETEEDAPTDADRRTSPRATGAGPGGPGSARAAGRSARI
jgi:hypothetical protein